MATAAATSCHSRSPAASGSARSAAPAGTAASRSPSWAAKPDLDRRAVARARLGELLAAVAQRAGEHLAQPRGGAARARSRRRRPRARRRGSQVWPSSVYRTGVASPSAAGSAPPGSVQGVFFRDTTRREAERRGVAGLGAQLRRRHGRGGVRGPGGRRRRRMVEFCRAGPGHARVERPRRRARGAGGAARASRRPLRGSVRPGRSLTSPPMEAATPLRRPASTR